MKKLSVFVFVLAMMGSIGVMAEESRLSGEAGADLYSKYIWRGQVAADVPSFQPAVSLSFAEVGPGSLTLGYWGSSMLKDSHADGDHFAENDYTLGYAFDMGAVSAELGAIYYTFPQGAFAGQTPVGDAFSTTEVYATFETGLVESEGLSIGASFGGYFDTDEISGAYYFNLGLGAEFAISGEVTGGLSLGIGYANSDYNLAYFGVDDDTLNDIVLEASASMPINETFGLSAALGYVDLLDSDLVGADSEIYAKIGISASF